MAKRKGKITQKPGQEHRRELVKLIEKFLPQFSIWQVWDDLMYTSAATLAQPCQWIQSREDECLRRIQSYPEELKQLFPPMLAEIIMAFEQEGFADILGETFEQLNLANARRGQFFTPYNVCVALAKMIGGSPAAEVKKHGFTSVLDPACGSGALLVGFAKSCVEDGLNPQQDVLFVGQDVDHSVAKMCHVQLSVLGLPGYVIIGNSLTQPPIDDILFPESNCDREVWYTPMFFSPIWTQRRLYSKAAAIMDYPNEKDIKEGE